MKTRLLSDSAEPGQEDTSEGADRPKYESPVFRTEEKPSIPLGLSSDRKSSATSFQSRIPFGSSSHGPVIIAPPTEVEDDIERRGSNRSLYLPPAPEKPRDTKPDATTATSVSPVEPVKWSVKTVVTELAVVPLTMVVSIFTYCPFCIATVVQSTVTRKAVDTDKWKDEMKGWSWMVGMFFFVCLLMYPTGAVGWLDNKSGVTAGLVVFCFLLSVFSVQILTISYAFLKPGLGMVSIPASRKLTIMHWRNLLVLVAPLFEFLQFTALAFRTQSDSWLCRTGFGLAVRGFTRVAGLRLSNLNCDAMTIQTPELLLNSAIFAFSLTLVYALCLGYAIAKLLQPGHWLCTIVFEVFAGIAYIPITSRLMSLLACQTVTVDGTAHLYLSYADPTMPSVPLRCWQGTHKKYGAMAFAGLILFGLSAIFVGSYKADKHVRRSAVTFIPRLVVVRRTLNSCLLAINLILAYIINDTASLTTATQISGMVVLSVLLIFDLRYNSCTFKEIRLLATGAHSASLWSYVATSLVTSGRVSAAHTTVLMLAGWFVVAVGIVGGVIWTQISDRAAALKDDVLFLGERRMEESGEVLYRVVTMNRRMRVLVGPGVEDEEVVIAQTIYGGMAAGIATDGKDVVVPVSSSRKNSVLKVKSLSNLSEIIGPGTLGNNQTLKTASLDQGSPARRNSSDFSTNTRSMASANRTATRPQTDEDAVSPVPNSLSLLPRVETDKSPMGVLLHERRSSGRKK
ncbi:hypothetical protein HKX48_002183 [Thoreauomyces humboldtii]|nr:hypothetical protein HKX48_002183 [Thoreauomyces humboldtii]